MSQLVRIHQRFGKPQVYALILLAVFAGECFWFSAHRPATTMEMSYVSPAHLTEGHAGAGQARTSPIVMLLAKSSLALPIPTEVESPLWRVLLRAPFVLIGALLGASLWYVSRRLYGNAGGYIALTFYSFSPAIIQRWTAVQPDVLAAWGTFGCVFTGIAVAHTLYAPRAVVLWNWRRILLLGVAVGVAMSAMPTTLVAVPIALAFMLYLAPHRKGAAVGILASACGVGVVVWLSTHLLSLPRALASMEADGSFHLTLALFSRGVIHAFLGGFLLQNGPAFVTLLAVSIGVWLGWRHTRFFGTAAPLIVALVLALFAVAMTGQDVTVLLYVALPFLFVFVGGVSADLLELKCRYSDVVKSAILATVLSHCLFSVLGLVHLSRLS